MSLTRIPLCVEEFAREFESHGLTNREAVSFASRLLVDRPIRNRKALDRVIQNVTQCGMDPTDAQSLVWSVMVYRALEKGTEFSNILQDLQAEGLSYEEALASSLMGRQLERRIHRNSFGHEWEETVEIEIPLGLLFLLITTLTGLAIILSRF